MTAVDLIVKKAGARTKKSQGTAWGKIGDKIDKISSARPDDHISTILAEMRELDIGRPDPNSFYRKRELVQPLGKAVLKRVGKTYDDFFIYPDVTNGQYTTSAVSSIRYLMGCVRDDTTAIVELGSGWSVNLFQIYVGLGQTRSKTIDYHGAEYTDEGQAAARRLAAHDGKINYHAHSFDYRNPDISFLNDVKGHILVFTRHSIEQVDVIDPRLYDMLAALDAEVTLVHIEPTGWQRDKTLLYRRKAKDNRFFEDIGGLMLSEVSSRRRQLENAAWWSWRLDYNLNLSTIIGQASKKGQIRIVRREYDYVAAANILNPSSLYHLEFVRGAAVEPTT
ncbi:MAG: hypothetical protein ACI8U3_001182 [Brevundimonas sp.]|jgi:hypothetical protein|uniref:hypothetical protein n=1 Tax=Brevundimonas sp. TaxID=1871086 RepID=UPI0039E3C507